MKPSDLLIEYPDLAKLSHEEKITYEKEISLFITNASDLMSLKEQYAEVIQKLSELENNVDSLKKRLFPTIYLGQAKHHSSKEPYIVARSPWRKGTNDYAHLRVYVGSTSNFKDGIDDPEVTMIAKQKIRSKIKQLFDLKE